MVITGRLRSLLLDKRFWTGAIVALALVLGWPSQQAPVVWPDSEAYLATSPDRLPVYSLLVAVTRDSYALICVQFVLSLAAWTALGFTVAGAAGALVAVVVALAWPVALWNHTVLSESLSLALFAAALAATVLLVKGWTRNRLIAWCALAALFAFTRSTNVFMLPFFIVPFLPGGRRRLLVAAAVTAAVLFSWGIYGQTLGSSLRETSLLNVYLNRIMHDRSRLDYFVARGMPVDNRILAFVDRKSRQNKEEMFAAAPEFAEWFREKGASSYRSWLLSGTLSFRQAWGVMVDNINYPYPEYDDGMRSRAINRAAHAAYNICYLPWWLWLLGVLTPLVSLALLRRMTPESLFVPALMAGSYVQAYVGYHGDATEMARHCILSLIGYKTTLLFLVFWIFVVVKQRLQSAPAPGTAAARDQKKAGRKRKSRGKRNRR